MNKKNFDSDFCGSLPLHQINLIQPYGYLLVLGREDLRIIQASENVNELFGLNANQFVGTFFRDYIRKEEADSLYSTFQTGITEKVPLSLTLKTEGGTARFIAIAHVKSEYLILEIEKAGEENSFLDVFQELKYVMAEINRSETVSEASAVVVHQLKKLSGFDKILMYRFDDDWNGTVIAEVKEDEMDPYLGLKFPASDIPRQARQLYLKNPYRLIPSGDYTPVRLYPIINPVSHTFIDLSDCNLRAVAGVHLEYMRNMKISASMSIRIIRNDKLWGLISCHHRKPKYLNYEMCSVFELLSSVISSKISSIENREYFQFINSLQEKKARLISNTYSCLDLHNGLLMQDINVADLFNAGGAAMVYKGRMICIGSVPGEEDLNNLIYWLQSKEGDRIYSTRNLAGEYEQAANFKENASGIISIPIDAGNGDYLIVFRPEVIKTVNWGGNPEEAINFEADKQKYHPRNSFASWQEIVMQSSLSWRAEELELAESLRSFIFEFTTKYLKN